MPKKAQQQLEFNSAGKEINILTGLNEAQKKAVTHKDGPLLIIAGAGTGKTTVITRRIAYLISEKIAKPSEILALTFTEKAAAEMEERVDLLVPYGYTDMWISTFHAFADRLLRDFALDLGLPVNFKVLTSVEQAIFIRQNIYAFELKYYRPLSNPLSHIQALISHFSRLKDELIEPDEYIQFAQTQMSRLDSFRSHAGQANVKCQNEDYKIEAEKTLELAKAYQRYNELMLQAGNLDFGDQIFLTYKLLKSNKKVLAECHNKFKYILVDEYQDTNYAQNEIIKLLATKDQNITVVGDDDQSIYRFRGASISNILDFKDYYKDVTEIVLNDNYRSTKEILDATYKLIQNNNPDRLEIKNKINKRLISSKQGDEPSLMHCDTLSCEADSVVEKIKELKTKASLTNNDFAILVRANKEAEPFMQSLNIAGIPYIFSGSSGLMSFPEIKMIVSFLKCLVYTDDNLAFYQLATSEIYNVPDQILSEYYTQAKRSNRGIIQLIKKTTVGGEGLDAMKEIASDIDEFRGIKILTAGELLYQFLTKKKYLKTLSSNLTVENEQKIFRIAKFFDRIAEFNHTSEDRGVLNFLENLELILDAGEEIKTSDIDPDIDAVNILTVHAAKGLEWPVVFIVNCVSDRFPSRNRREALPIPDKLIKERLPEGDFHLEEERRLFYVAATRAKDYLFLTAADDYGGKRVKKLSQFVMELLDNTSVAKEKYKLSALEKIDRFKKVEEKEYKLPNRFSSEIIKLSRQQVDDYFSCPKKFYFAHIVKIPLLENQALMFGTAIHAALDHYFNRKLRNEKLTLDQLFADFNQAFKNVGFITREQEDLRKQSGFDVLAKFYDEDQKIEKEIANVEERFEFMEKNVKISGRFDLVYNKGENSEIVDFKTGNVQTQKDADRRIKESTQMMTYALAWKEKYGIIPKTTLYFIEPNLKGENTFTEDDLSSTRNMIDSVAEGIEKNDMAAKPDFNTCKFCPFRDICKEAK